MKTYICFDVGGTKINAALVNEKGEVSHFLSTPTKSKKQIKKIIIGLVNQLLLTGTSCSGISLGWPYPINISLSADKIKKILKNKFNLPIYIDNDANLFTLAETTVGLGRPYNSVMGLTLGTGVGGGLCINKKIYRGRKNAIEIGHMTLNYKGPMCVCGNNGCFELYAGSLALKKLAKKNKLVAKNGFELYQLATRGNKKALRIWQDYGTYLGIGMVNIINNFDPDLIILGGNISKAYKYFKGSMIDTIHEKSFLTLPLIKIGKIKQAGLIGAMLFAKNNRQ